MDPMILSALVAGGLSLIGGLLNNASINKHNEQLINYNNEVNQFNNEEQWKMWNANNNYNTPHEQMLRYSEAGLNPNLIYGQSNTASPVNVGNAAQLSGLQVKNYDYIVSMLNPLMQSLVSKVNADKTRADTTKVNNENELFDKTFDYQVDMTKFQRDQLEKNLTIIGYAIEDRDIDKAVKLLNKEIMELEKTHKNINTNYDISLSEMGLPPDIDARDAMLFMMLGSLFKGLTGKILNFKEILEKMGDDFKDMYSSLLSPEKK